MATLTVLNEDKDLERNIENDPLYMAVINAKNAQERERAVKTLSSIRGSTAVSLLIQYLKKKGRKTCLQ